MSNRAIGLQTVVSNLFQWRKDKVDGLGALSSGLFEPRLETHAKRNRPWTDRTGAARRGLTATHRYGADHFSILLWHTVFYGKFLELRFAGRYAILEPTMREVGPEIIEQVRRYWSS